MNALPPPKQIVQRAIRDPQWWYQQLTSQQGYCAPVSVPISCTLEIDRQGYIEGDHFSAEALMAAWSSPDFGRLYYALLGEGSKQDIADLPERQIAARQLTIAVIGESAEVASRLQSFESYLDFLRNVHDYLGWLDCIPADQRRFAYHNGGNIEAPKEFDLRSLSQADALRVVPSLRRDIKRMISTLSPDIKELEQVVEPFC